MAHVIRTLSGKTTWKEDLWAPMIQPIACCAMATRQLKCGWLVGLNAGMLAGLFACPQRPALYVLLLNDMPHILSDCQLRHTNCWNSGTCNTSNQPPVSHKFCLKHGLDPKHRSGLCKDLVASSSKGMRNIVLRWKPLFGIARKLGQK